MSDEIQDPAHGQGTDNSEKDCSAVFYDVGRFLAIPRVDGLTLSPDGRLLVVGVEEPARSGKVFVRSLWAVDPEGLRPARRLTRSAAGESGPAFHPDGALLFLSTRSDQESEAPRSALWRLPADGGEAEPVVVRAGGIIRTKVASRSGTIVFSGRTMRGTLTAEEDVEARRMRSQNAITAVLHESYPIRSWDQDLGPEEPRLFIVPRQEATGDAGTVRDVTPEPGRALDGATFDISANGRRIITSWTVREANFGRRQVLVEIDTAAPAARSHRVVASDPNHNFSSPALAPDGRSLVCIRERRVTPDDPPRSTLWWQPLDGGAGLDLTANLSLDPQEAVWSPDGRTVYFVADQNGRRPVFAIDIRTRTARRLAADGAYSELSPAPDGQRLYALRSAVDTPPAPVALDVAAEEQQPRALRGPAERPALPGSLLDVEAAAQDGTPLRSWLGLPRGATAETPCPLLVWIHGGPHSSWNSWHWRWNPWVMAAHGYAVLLPDPGLSTGYGQGFLRRGHQAWDGTPLGDVLSMTDAACARPDISAEATAAMGASFGGYLVNSLASRTGRFRCLVVHSGLWAMEQYAATTDLSIDWRQQLPPERALAISPHHGIEQIMTPMLLIHGDRDYRVPVSQSLRLWCDLIERHTGDPQNLPHRFLQFPDEGHWVRKPQNAKIWYETVLAFLAWHVKRTRWRPPESL